MKIGAKEPLINILICHFDRQGEILTHRIYKAFGSQISRMCSK